MIVGFSLLGYGFNQFWLYYVAGGIGLLSIYPPLARVISKVWMTIGRTLGWINTKILLTIFFIIVIIPISLIHRLFKRKSDFFAGKWKDAEPGTNFAEPW